MGAGNAPGATARAGSLLGLAALAVSWALLFSMREARSAIGGELMLMTPNTMKPPARSAIATTVRMMALDLPPEFFMCADLGEARADCQHGMDPTAPAREAVGDYRRA
jgi:hypothetical protein